MMEEALDIIKYISFYPKKSKVLSVCIIPISCKTIKKYHHYHYNIINKKYLSSMLKFSPMLNNGYNKVYHSCRIKTVFGDTYYGSWRWVFYEENKNEAIISIYSNEEMRYENNYLRSINYNKRFELMDI